MGPVGRSIGPVQHDCGSVHRLLRIVSIALITAGLVILVDVGLTLAWKEPLSSIYGSLKQQQAEDELTELEESFPGTGLLRRALGEKELSDRVAVLADAFARRAERGEGIGRMVIPRIDLDVVVVEGTDTGTLQRGPGHYTLANRDALSAQGNGSAFPGQGETVGIAGHRTTYLAPFRRIDEIRPGDEITMQMPYATFTYTVQKHEIVDPDAVEIVENVGYDRLVLTACHPLYSAAQRYVQFAKLTDMTLFAAGERLWQNP